MSYKITIERTTTKTTITHGEYQIIDTMEVSREKYSTDEEPTRIKNVYGYAPDVEKTVTEKQQLLIQEVDELDLPKVIMAINNLD